MTSSSSASDSPDYTRGWQAQSSNNTQWSDTSTSTIGHRSINASETPTSSSGLRSLESSSSAGSIKHHLAHATAQGFAKYSGGSGGDSNGYSSAHVVGGLANASLSPVTLVQSQQGSAPVTSPLFDCVSPLQQQQQPPVETAMSSRSSDAELGTRKPPSASVVIVNKQLPSLPPPDEEDDMPLAIAPGGSRSHSPLYTETSPGAYASSQRSSPSHDYYNAPFAGSSSSSTSRNRLSPFTSGLRDKQGKGKIGRAWKGKKSVPLAAEDPNLIGLGVQSATAADSDAVEKDAGQNWATRAAAMKAASQTAGQGLKKWGKATGAKLRQAQQTNREVSPRLGWNLHLSGDAGLKRYDGRAAKSAADLPKTSSDVDMTPPMPMLHSASPDPRIGLPTDVRHNVHVDVGPEGYTGLPMSWAQVLAQHGMDAEEVRRNPADAVRLIREQTQYFVDQEAERGHDPEYTKHVLESRLGHLENMEEAREAVRSATPGPRQARQSFDNLTRSDATARRVSNASTTYSSVLNQGWPASPTWSDAPSLPKVPSLQKEASPILPNLEQDESDEDWGTSLLRALPNSSSVKSDLSSRRRTMSLDGHTLANALHTKQVDDNESDGEGEDEELQDDQEEEMTEDLAVASIHVASKVGSARFTSASHSLSSSDSDMRGALRMMDRRESAKSALSSSASIASSFNRQESASDARNSSKASRSVSPMIDEAVTTPTSPISMHAVQSASSIAQQQATRMAPLRPSSSSSNATATSELSSQLSHGLRERRKNTPRIYPPSSKKFVVKEDAPSPRSIGFKPAVQATSPVNSQQLSQRGSSGSASTMLSGDGFYRAERFAALGDGHAEHGRGNTPDSGGRSIITPIETGRNSGASVRLASMPLHSYLQQDTSVKEESTDQCSPSVSSVEQQQFQSQQGTQSQQEQQSQSPQQTQSTAQQQSQQQSQQETQSTVQQQSQQQSQQQQQSTSQQQTPYQRQQQPQSRLSPAQQALDTIQPDADGFFRPSSIPSSKQPRSPGAVSTRSDMNSPTLARHEDPQSQSRPPRPVVRKAVPALRESIHNASEHVASSHGDTYEDYEPASDFLDHWMNSSDNDYDDAEGTLYGDFDSAEPSSARFMTTPNAAGALMSTESSFVQQGIRLQSANSDTSASPSSMAVPAHASQHQSPSPALLQGLPTPLRTQFDIAITSSKHSSPPVPMNGNSKANANASANWLSGSSKANQSTGWSLHPNSAELPQAEGRVARDWRARSLPPPPADEDGRPEAEIDMSVEARNRASIASLPLQDEQYAQNDNGNGPPAADEEALEAAAMTRPSSRASRSSSRAGSRSTRRRSSDVRRFPLSMHLSGGDDETMGADAEAAASFAELMRTRQSMDLDDVMPLHIDSTASDVPPVPSLPSLLQVGDDRQDEHLTSPINIVKTNGGAAHKVDRLPPSIRHLSPLLREEDPRDVFGDLVLIGEGDSGNVFTALPLPTCQIASIKGLGKVAIKIVQLPRRQVGQDADDARAGHARLMQLDKELMLWREGGQHGNIVLLYETFTLTDTPNTAHTGVWIAHEFMSISLADMIALKVEGLVIEESHMARIVHDLCAALQHLHTLQIMHRDVRSDNVMLTFDGVAKLSDFTHAASLRTQNKRSSVIGTAYWMAPEVIRAEQYDTQVDIWSLGAVLYELVEGKPPRIEFPALRAITLTMQMGLPALGAPERSSSALKACLAWCTEMTPEQRPTAEMLLQSAFVNLACPHAEVAQLIESARMMEAETAPMADEEVMDEAEQAHFDARTSGNGRDSWTSQSTVHA